MTVADLAATCGATVRGDRGAQVTGVTHHAQSSHPDWVFAALPGARHHGIEFLPEARQRGVTVVLSDRDPGSDVTWLASATPRQATALAAWALAGHPEQRLRLVGITGTNGKSTVAAVISEIARAADAPVGLFGTLTYSLPGHSEPASRTTPEAPDLAPMLARLAEQENAVAVMEVSSHALAMDRVAGLPFDVAVWTNLTRDHLDFHGSLDEYFAVKSSLTGLLRDEPPGRRVVGADDPTIARLLQTPRAGDLTFGLDDGRDVTAAGAVLSLEGTSFQLRSPLGDAPVTSSLVGRHNLRNLLAAAAAGVALDLPLESIVTGLTRSRPLPGRLEPVPVTGTPVFVDYAHTPDGLEQVLTSLREVSSRRLIVVFGCGGDRDPGKRGPMGEVVGRLADVPIVTSDNPRSEDPLAIIEQVMTGVRSTGNARALAIADRREAIGAALSVANGSSLIVIAGKGHEREQIFADHTVPFDDRQVAAQLARRRHP